MEEQKEGRFFFASESVGEGHPDKLCDQVSDAILDACLAIDPEAKLGLETATKTGMLVLLGEVTCKDRDTLNFEQIARDVCREIGFVSEDVGLDADKMEVIVNVPEQEQEIANAVYLEKEKEEDQGAGDQGLMFGYATDESPTLHPLTHVYTNKLAEKLKELRISKEVPWLRPDCKTQITMEYKQEGGHIEPVGVYNILVSTQHEPDITNEEIEQVIKEKVIADIIPEEFLKNTKYFINPSGKFSHGGPYADAGLTGRKNLWFMLNCEVECLYKSLMPLVLLNHYQFTLILMEP